MSRSLPGNSRSSANALVIPKYASRNITSGHHRVVINGDVQGGHDGADAFVGRHTVAQDLTDVHEALDNNGSGVSGPAARRLINAADTQHRRFGGLVTTTRQARSLLADPALNVLQQRSVPVLQL